MDKHRCGDRCLDIGGASGRFAETVKKRFSDYHITVVDPSQEMLNGITSPDIEKIQGHLPDHLNLVMHYDYISLNDVLHHICGRTEEESKALSIKSLQEIRNILASEGVLLLHELFYESYVREDITRSVIFRWLNIQNRLQLEMPINELLLGLRVNFYSRAELRSIIEQSGYRIVDYYHFSWSEPKWKKRLLFLKDWGDAFFVLKKVI